MERGFARAAVFFLLLAAGLLLTGCGRRAVFDGSRTSGKTGFSMEYALLDREETAEVELSAGERLEVSFSHTAGSVDVVIAQAGEEPLYRGNGQTDAQFVLTAAKPGVYRISVTGHRARGKVSFAIVSGE